ncbi:hypothetical protein Zmor_019535 [Zophobas morio]|uniref:Uncharacterized protein n=1 Tax=Zophobas morio TaxID=2755281 RepID=A0AA38I213_9CUCU|nr:hypothetical protein Zmor_019535 [Zophobas morio]
MTHGAKSTTNYRKGYGSHLLVSPWLVVITGTCTHRLMVRWGQPPMRLWGLGVRAIRMCLCPSFRESIKCSGHWMVIAHYQTLTLVQFQARILHTLWICNCVSFSWTKRLYWAFISRCIRIRGRSCMGPPFPIFPLLVSSTTGAISRRAT